MSNALLNLAMPLAMSPTDKVVLLVLADAARDPQDSDRPGQTWLPMRGSSKEKAGLVERTCLGERTIQRALRSLEATGHISTAQIPGRGAIYTVHPRHSGTPATAAPRQRDTPAIEAPTPATAAPNPLETSIPQKASPSSGSGARERTNQVQQVFEAWNAMASDCSAKGADKLTAGRKTAIKARIAEYGLPVLLEAIASIPSKPWLMGDNDRSWTAGLDWLLRPDSITKLREGNYDGSTADTSPRQRVDPERAAAKAEEQAGFFDGIGQREKAEELRARARQLRIDAMGNPLVAAVLSREADRQRRQDRPSAWAPQTGMEGLEPYSLDDDLGSAAA